MTDKITTVEQFRDRISDGVHADIDDMPRGMMVAWFGGTMWKPGEAVPFDEYSRVIAIFQNDDVARVYSLPAAPPNPIPGGWKVKSPIRYSLTKTAATYVAEVMDLTTFADEIINEWNEVALGMSSAEAEREAIIDHIESFGAEVLTGSVLVQELRDEIHLADDDDDSPDDEPNDEPAAPSVPPAPPGAPVMEVAK
jgi:hypothetical protein